MDDDLGELDPALLGLPAELPPVRLPDFATLAAHARASALIARARDITTLRGDHTTIMEPTLDFSLLFRLAEVLGFLEVTGKRARMGTGLDEWPDGSDQAVVDVWDAALEFVLVESYLFDENLDLPDEPNDEDEDEDYEEYEEYESPDLAPAGPSLMFSLLVAGMDGLHRDELDGHPFDTVGDPIPTLLDLLVELGAVEIDGDTVTLAPLGLRAMRERYVAMGVDIPLVPPVAEMTATDLLLAAPAFAEEEYEAEARSWVAMRTPERAGEELVRAAAESGAVARMLAVALIKSNGLGTEALWRSALERVEVRPYAKVELGEQPDTAEAAWLLTDALAAMGDVDEAFAEAVPVGAEQDVFDAMWRSSHPDAAAVLTVIGQEHPDKKIAKAARKAAFKAASR